MKRLFFVICMIMVSMTFAKKWDATYIGKLIASGGIDKVIEYYNGRYYGENRDPQDAFRIAELYVKKKDYAAAMKWYDKESQLINTSKVNLFNYANTNRLMGQYQNALDGYLMYAALTGDVNKVMDLANQCEKILKSSTLSYNYKLENYSFNTSSDETNVAVLRTNAVYVTIQNADNKEEKPSYEIYQVVRAFENFAEPVKAYNNNIPKLVITSLSYTQDGNSVVFSTRDEKSLSKKGKAKNEKIYIADNLGGSFLNVKPFPFNIDGYSFKNPAFNTDGTAIYFSSNQPGGVGGFDIWESSLIKDKWTTPKNLGKLLNSTADEINPFIVQDAKNNTLYFSSDREGGFGGFDIYKAKQTNNIWQDVEMQTAPINSAGDDISIIYDDEIKTGYFSSNRTGGKGGFDVYRFTPFNLKLIVYANDTFSDKIIDYALVQVYDGGEKLFEGVTDETGKAVFQINKGKTYTLKISKDSYRPITQKINSIGKTNGDSVVANALLKPDAQFSISKGATNNLSLDNYIIFTGKVIDAATNKPASAAKMRMVNYTTQKLREVDIDATGKFEIKLLLNNNYKIIFENQENKITDEFTTYGLEKNNVKVRDYLLAGSKLKLTENKVYKTDNVPPSLNIKLDNRNKNTSGSSLGNEKQEPITQTKIDSLIKVIAKDNPPLAQAKKTLPPAKTVISPPASVTENIIEIKQEQTVITAEQKTNTEVKISAPKSEEVIKEAAPKFVKIEKRDSIKPIKVNKEEEPLLAADMVSTKKVKKVKAIEKKNVEVAEIVIPEKTTEPLKEDMVVEKITESVKSDPKTEKIKEPEVKIAEIPKLEQKPVVAAITTIPTPAVSEVKIETPQTEAALLPDIYYKIQLASYDEGNIKYPEFEHLGKIEEVKAYDRFIYRLGNFETLERAKEILELVRTQGYFVAFILQYNKDKVTGIVK